MNEDDMVPDQGPAATPAWDIRVGDIVQYLASGDDSENLEPGERGVVRRIDDKNMEGREIGVEWFFHDEHRHHLFGKDGHCWYARPQDLKLIWRIR